MVLLIIIIKLTLQTWRSNLQPDRTICRSDESPRGKKKQKLRITVFLTVNAYGSEKTKAIVIERAHTPDAFRHTRINRDNLPVIYRHNKKAWMLSGLWYEYLTELNHDMALAGRKKSFWLRTIVHLIPQLISLRKAIQAHHHLNLHMLLTYQRILPYSFNLSPKVSFDHSKLAIGGSTLNNL